MRAPSRPVAPATNTVCMSVPPGAPSLMVPSCLPILSANFGGRRAASDPEPTLSRLVPLRGCSCCTPSATAAEPALSLRVKPAKLTRSRLVAFCVCVVCRSVWRHDPHALHEEQRLVPKREGLQRIPLIAPLRSNGPRTPSWLSPSACLATAVRKPVCLKIGDICRHHSEGLDPGADERHTTTNAPAPRVGTPQRRSDTERLAAHRLRCD